MMMNLKVYIFCKIHVYLMFPVTKFDVLPESVSGTWYILCKALFSSPVPRDNILMMFFYWPINGKKTQLNKYNKYEKLCCVQTLAM